MIRIRPSDQRGRADLGWLDSRHTFSFADYFDPEHISFGPLRVINQDRVRGGGGFATHAHSNMEIVSVVLEGVLEHKDSEGNGSQLAPGNVQLMSAGSGIMHSEYNASADEPVHFLQMWVHPRRQNTPPRYQEKSFDEETRRGKLRLVVSPDGADDSITIGQDARLHLGIVGADDRIEHALDERMAWIHVARGGLLVNDRRLGPGDGAAVTGEPALTLVGRQTADVVLWEFPTA